MQNAGQVGHRRDMVMVLDMFDNVQGLFAAAAAGAVGAGDKIRF